MKTSELYSQLKIIHQIIRNAWVKLINRFNATSQKKIYFALATTSIILLSIFIFAAHSLNQYNSDDVAIQNIIQSFESGAKRDAIAGTDNFVIKTPLYALSHIFSHNSRLILLVLNLVFTVTLASGLYWMLYKYIKASKVDLSNAGLLLVSLPVIWILSFAATNDVIGSSLYSAPTNSMWLNPNVRNAEIGICLIFVIIYGSFLFKKMANWKSYILPTIILGLMFGLFFYNDPYFLYTFGIALGATVCLLWLAKLVSYPQATRGLLVLALSLFSIKIFHNIFASFGFTAADNVSKRFISLDQLYVHVQNTISAFFQVFNANIWAQPLGHRIIIPLFSAASLTGLVFGFVWMLRRNRILAPATNPKQDIKYVFYRVVILLTILMIILAYLLTDNSGTSDTFRYLFPIIFFVAIFGVDILISIQRHKNMSRFYGVLLVLLLFTVGLNVFANTQVIRYRYSQNYKSSQAVNYEVVKTIHSLGLSKGYTDYWNGNIHTYLSNREILFLPIVCLTDNIYRFNWLINKPDFQLAASTSFYLRHNGEVAAVSACNKNTTDAIFGHPVRTIEIAHGQYTLYVYDHDIGTSLPEETPQAH